jgi:hypothetical protein
MAKDKHQMTSTKGQVPKDKHQMTKSKTQTKFKVLTTKNEKWGLSINNLMIRICL